MGVNHFGNDKWSTIVLAMDGKVNFASIHLYCFVLYTHSVRSRALPFAQNECMILMWSMQWLYVHMIDVPDHGFTEAIEGVCFLVLDHHLTRSSCFIQASFGFSIFLKKTQLRCIPSFSFCDCKRCRRLDHILLFMRGSRYRDLVLWIQFTTWHDGW